MNKNTNIIVRVNSDLKERVTELARKNGVTLSQLITASLVSICHDGQIPYSMVKYLPLKYGEEKLLTISFIKEKILKCLEENKVEDVRKVYLFGSYARGDATPKSDVNLRVEFDRKNYKTSGLNFFGFCGDLERFMSKKVEVVSRDINELPTSYAEVIKKEQICIIER